VHEQGDTAARVVQLLTGLLTATDRAAADPRGVLAGLGDFLFRSFQDSSFSGRSRTPRRSVSCWHGGSRGFPDHFQTAICARLRRPIAARHSA
jgi:hypothetical protein